MRYSQITDAYTKIESTSKRLEMTDYLVELINDTPKELIGKVAYLTQGKLYPNYKGIELGMAEKMVITAIAKATEISKANIVETWKSIGDLGTTTEKLLKQKMYLKGTKASKLIPTHPLTTLKIYNTLDKIAHTTGKGSVETKVNLLLGLIVKATPVEAKYLVRTVTGRLRLGIGDMTFLDALAIAYGGGKDARSDIEIAYNKSSDLGLVSETLARSGLEGIVKFRIKLDRPIRPMLAGRLTSAEEILKKLGGKGAAEYKFDGLRIQAHISSDKISLFSRRLENITNQFPDVKEALEKSITYRNIIVEGECIALDANTGEIQPFQVVTRRRGRKYEILKTIAEIPVRLVLFDILFLAGRSLLTVPYPHRRKYLEEVIVKTENVQIANNLIVTKEEQLEEFMEKAVEKGCEGLVIKSMGPDSTYQAGARGFHWIKYKREYKSELADTLDLVVVGALAGRGRRAGLYGALIMAAYDEDSDTFKTVCKLGTGFDDETLAQFPKSFEKNMNEYAHFRVDSKIEADYWFIPEKVLEVRGAELTLSPSHTCGLDLIKKGAGLAVRFPRFTGRWRKDKDPHDATTVKEVVAMYKAQLKTV